MIKTLDKMIIRTAAISKDKQLLEKIQNACREKQAFCFGSDDARIVLKPRSRDGIPYVVVWLGVSISRDGLERYTPKVQELTRMIGGRWAEFYTVRKGFIRKARQLGFERLPDEDGLMKFRIPV
ncbi:hypothetical protein Z042_23220 [Chania multitudinisentens RB-25]|uniref:Uncharacterized protein n=1 Tax=Chania multitudinisentens RB-25 TaxID=1441930 RepID=W0LJL9_9GAMM|nr:hypothetical protein [Chania multitudinisentens]AHG22195.1 hypothetical protein Z042_23220 [Chania multitudinisentens RB-25]